MVSLPEQSKYDLAQMTGDYLLEGGYCVPKLQWIKFAGSVSEEDAEETSLNEREEEDCKDSPKRRR